METLSDAKFKQNYASHLKHLKLKGLRPKTIDAYSRAIRRNSQAFRLPDRQPDRAATDRFFQPTIG